MPESPLFPDLIFSDRLRIDLFTAADTGFIIALLNSKGWLDGIGDRNVRTEEQAGAFIHRVNHTRDFRYWAARVKETGKPIGMISCIKREYLDDFDLGFAFLPDYNGKGYALEGAGEVLRTLKANPRFNRMLAFALPANAPSVRLLEKLDFHYESQFENTGSTVSLYVNTASYK